MKLNRYKIIFVLLAWFSFAGDAFAQSEPSESDRGIELYRQNEYQKAADILQAVVAADKKNRQAWMYLGMSYAKLGDLGKAIKYLRKAEGISVKNVPAEKSYDQQSKIITKPRPRLPDKAREDQTFGSIKLVIELAANGKDIFVVPLSTLPDRLTEEFVRAAQSIKFEPAVKNGKAVSSIKIIEYSFVAF